jgi:hypothetical protein
MKTGLEAYIMKYEHVYSANYFVGNAINLTIQEEVLFESLKSETRHLGLTR